MNKRVRATDLDRAQEGNSDIHGPCPHNEDGTCGRNLDVGGIGGDRRVIETHPVVGCPVDSDLASPTDNRRL